MDPRSVSGMDVLRHIKEINRGTQVIMFTASNKAWNLKALMDEGVDGYYIKPSPEYYTDAFIESNFESLRDTIKHCLNRSYLRFLYKRLEALKKICDNCLLSKEYSNPIKSHLDVSFSLLSSAGNDAQYSYAFLALFGVLEEFVQYFITTEINGKTLYYYEDLKLDNNKVGNWTIRDNRIIKKDGDAKTGEFSIAHKVIAIERDVFNKGLSVANSKMLMNLRDRRNSFVHKVERDLSYPSVDTPLLSDHRAYEELFRIVEIILTDSKKKGKKE